MQGDSEFLFFICHPIDKWAIGAAKEGIGTELFDQHATMAALEHLVNVAMDKEDSEAEKYSIILRQCHPLVDSKAFQGVLIQLVATKQEAES